MRPYSISLGVHNLVFFILHTFAPSALSIASKDSPKDFDNAEPLLCNAHCYCTVGKEDRVICNETTAQLHSLTTHVFDPFLNDSKPSNQIYVLVQNANQVIVTKSFLLKWNKYDSSALDFWMIEDLVFEPRSNITKNKYKSRFGGVGIVNSTVSELPVGLITNKKYASLLFRGSIVDLIPSHTLVGVEGLRYLEIKRSRIGLLQGSAASKPLILNRRPGDDQRDVLLRNSTFGIIEANAIHIVGHQRRFGKSEQFILSNSSIGFMERSAIQLEGQLVTKVTETWIHNMEAESLKINSSSSVNIVNNTFIGQPGLMVYLPCGDLTVVEGNLLIPKKSLLVIPRSQMNMDADSSVNSSVSTVRSKGLGTPTDKIKPSYVLESSSSTTEILKPNALPHRPVTAYPLSLQAEVRNLFFHTSCMHNFAISRNSIIKRDVVTVGLDLRFIVFILLACCILLLILLLCIAVLYCVKKKTSKITINEEPVLHWSTRASAPVPSSCDLRHSQAVMVSDEHKSENTYFCQSSPDLCISNTLDCPQACRTQQSLTVSNENVYWTMRSPDSKLESVNAVCHPTFP